MKSDQDRALYRVRLNPLVALEESEALRYIRAIDFSMVVKKLSTPDENIPKLWAREAAQEAIHYYKNYLSILRVHGSHFDYIPPSLEIDEIWHHHILDTYKYQEDCLRIFGVMLHHYPYFGMRGEADFANLALSFEGTQRLHKEMFGEAIPAFESVTS